MSESSSSSSSGPSPTIVERINSRPVNSDGSVDFLYAVSGTNDEQLVLTTVAATRPAWYASAGVILLPASPECDWQHTEDGDGLCYVTVRYSQLPPTQPFATGEDSFEFDTSGVAVQHITQAISTVAAYNASGAIAGGSPFKGAIGVGLDGSVAGVDLPPNAPFRFSFTRHFAENDINWTYINLLFGITGKTNNAAWSITIDGIGWSFSEGEVYFYGARGSKRRTALDYEITYQFGGSPNIAAGGLPAIGDISYPAKKGFEYLWVYYDRGADNTLSIPTIVPKYVIVEQVCQAGDFNTLEPGYSPSSSS